MMLEDRDNSLSRCLSDQASCQDARNS
jgi:hypothetical protein